MKPRHLAAVAALAALLLQPFAPAQAATVQAQALEVAACNVSSPAIIQGYVPLTADVHGTLCSVAGGAGGTSSSFAAAFPATGTAIGAKNGANMVFLAADGSNNLDVNCIVGCAGGSFNNNADAVATSATNGQSASWLYGYNGTTWDRLRVDASKFLQVTIAAASASNISVNDAQVSGTATSVNNGVVDAGTQRVTLASNSTGQVTLAAGANTIGALSANQSTNEAQINGVTPLMGNGVTGTGSQRVTIASDNTAFAVNSTLQTQADTTMVGGANIKEINAVAPLMGNGVTGTGSLRVTLASDTSSNTNPLLFNQSQVNGVALLAGNGVTGTGSQRVTIASDNTAFSVNTTAQTQTDTIMTGGVNIKEINAVAPLMGNGVTGTGSQRVTIASDNTAFAVNATLQTGAAIVGKVGIDQTTDITTNGVEIAPTAAAAAGITPVVSTVIESGHVLKASAGNLYSVTATVNNNANGQIMVFNSATVPADGAVTPIECINVNAGGTVSINPGTNGPPEAFSTGISVAFSSAGSCVSKTASANAFFNGKVK